MSRLAEKMTGAKIEPWIGCDLDGTLAKQSDKKPYDSKHIGEPIKPMVDRVKKWLEKGKKVKIFTARADDEIAVNAIKAWCKEQGLGNLDVTNLKDRGMEEFWDDKAVAVEKNTGEIAESVVDILLETETIKWASVRFPDGKIFNDLTHHDAYYKAADFYGIDADSIVASAEDGFLTNAGRFVDREEAYQLAKAAGQHQPSDNKDPDEPWLEYGEVENDPRYGNEPNYRRS